MIDLHTWWAGGSQVALNLPSGSRSIFAHVEGDGPWLTLLHGFPSSSWDWSRVVSLLKGQFRVLTFDLLGYGASDKPINYAYNTLEHADTLVALWRHFSIKETILVGHDVGGTITKEILSRQLEGKLDVTLRQVVFMNSAVYVDHYKPLLITRLMHTPVIGPIIVGRLTEKRLSASLARIFSKEHPASPNDLRQTWEALSHCDGVRNIPELLHYLTERQRYFTRWHHSVEHTTVPLHFIWGMADPVTGRTIAQDIRRYKPDAPFIGYDDVGHFPQLEVPERIAVELGHIRNSA